MAPSDLLSWLVCDELTRRARPIARAPSQNRPASATPPGRRLHFTVGPKMMGCLVFDLAAGEALLEIVMRRY
jgi:hypothetical protein